MIRKILKWPSDSAALHTKSALVDAERDGAKIVELVADMFETMYTAGGIGLSAIQIGVPLRVVVMEVDEKKPRVLINPKIVERGGVFEKKNEGCLSLPGIIEEIFRHGIVKVEALDQLLQPFTVELRGLEAQCAQHEIEHLDGIVIVDHLTATRRDLVRKKIRKMEEEK